MTDEVYTDCPQCTEEIPFYRTVDELKECPECGTYWEDLFFIAEGKMEPADEPGAVATDGGAVTDE